MGEKTTLSQVILRALTIKLIRPPYTPIYSDISLSINLVVHPFRLFWGVYEQVPRMCITALQCVSQLVKVDEVNRTQKALTKH